MQNTEGSSIRTRGLTLIEVVVSVCLLAGALFTLGILIPRTVMHLRNHGFEAVAAQKAEDVINRTRGLDAADIPSGVFDGRDTTGSPPLARTPDVVKWSGKRRFPPALRPPIRSRM
ncbi:MAG: hypothetical protein FJX76_13840 [Armatimonadetes bacterium]|nr:hypothetical protein [Armatimonadota bacterium]